MNSPTPAIPKIYQQLGLACLQLGDFPAAEDAGRHVQRLTPGAADGYVLAGAACIAAGRYDDATVQTPAALVLRPDDAKI